MFPSTAIMCIATESRMGGKKGKGGGGGGGDGQLLVDPEAGPDLKEALEVCVYLWACIYMHQHAVWQI